MTGMRSAAQIWAATKQAMRAVPVLLQAPQVWVQRVEAEGGTRDAALRFWAIALAGLVAAPLIGLVWLFVILGSLILFGGFGGGGRPLAIVLFLAALALVRRLIGLGRRRGYPGPRGPRGPWGCRRW